MALQLLATLFLINVAVSLAAPQPYVCYNFDSISDPTNGWSNVGFKSSTSDAPSTYGIPYWDPPTTGYLFLQENTDPPRTGGLNSGVIEIFDGDTISASLYRHVLDYDSTDRISVSFSTDGITKTLLMNPNYDNWNIISATCGVANESCCPEYPCYGEITVDGYVVESDELVAIGYVAINDSPSSPACS